MICNVENLQQRIQPIVFFYYNTTFKLSRQYFKVAQYKKQNSALRMQHKMNENSINSLVFSLTSGKANVQQRIEEKKDEESEDSATDSSDESEEDVDEEFLEFNNYLTK